MGRLCWSTVCVCVCVWGGGEIGRAYEQVRVRVVGVDGVHE